MMIRRFNLFLFVAALFFLVGLFLALFVGLNNFFYPPSPVGGGDPQGPDVIFLVMDTFRADNIGPDTPNINEFIGDSVYYPNAYSSSSWTVPAHFSMWTGYYPTTSKQFDVLKNPVKGVRSFPKEAEKQGYATALITCNDLLLLGGFSDGFDYVVGSDYLPYHLITIKVPINWYNYRAFFRNIFGLDGEIDAKTINQMISRVLRKTEGQRRLIVANYMETHDPYNDAVSFDWYEFDGFFLTNIKNMEPEKRFWNENEGRQWVRTIDPETLTYGRKMYRASVVELDYRLGQLFDYLKETGEYDDALIILVSDHGEEFFEYGYVGHGWNLEDPTTRVFLAVKPPKSAGITPHEVKEVVDLTGVFNVTFDALNGNVHAVPLKHDWGVCAKLNLYHLDTENWSYRGIPCFEKGIYIPKT